MYEAIILQLFFSSCLLLFSYRRLLRYLQFFQQEDYDGGRFLDWLLNKHLYDKRGTLICLFTIATCFLLGSYGLLLGALALIYLRTNEEDPRYSGKVRLNMTVRARGIFRLAFFSVCFTEAITLFLLEEPRNLPWYSILWVQFLPLYLITAKLLLWPMEKKRQAKYTLEAKQILYDVSPYIIGITGSYGKTSTKLALAEVLQTTLGPTFWPQKGINADMGIVREIREKMLEGQKYAVIEMGAYYRGSIARLCKLTPPQAAIITAVGFCHLERFGSKDQLFQAKAELARALPEHGLLICNGDDPGAREIAKRFPTHRTRLYGFSSPEYDCKILNFSYKDTSMQFQLEWRGRRFQGQTQILGKASLSNLAAAFLMAVELGADPQFVLAAISALEPVDNRLKLSRSGEQRYLNDAYNSNPAGFSQALDLLKDLPAERRVLMTPGMIELGEWQFEENHRAAQKAAQVCDLALIVGSTNAQALIDGLIEGGMPEEHIITCKTREEAFAAFRSLQEKGDLLLIENDLNDLYESNLKL